jgi:hypothetical protein
MRAVILLIAIVFLLMESGGRFKPVTTATLVSHESVASSSSTIARVDFDTQLKPIFQSRCMPCHFSGGQMYERLPFDRSETIRKLGTKLFTRIRKEEERQLLEQFLKQSP